MTGAPAITTGPETLATGSIDTYSDYHSLATAEHAVAVYEQPAEYGLLAMRAGFDAGTIVEVGSAQCGIAWSPKAIVISARGSSERRDWYVDALSVVRVGWRGYLPPGVRVGWGFRRQADRLIPRLQAHLLYATQRHPSARVFVTGHSLGAALVPLLMVWLAGSEWWPSLELAAYMHEAPRVGGKRFAEHYRQTMPPTYSVVNVIDGEVDLITRVPKKSWGFRHVGRRVVITEDGSLRGWDDWTKWRATHPVGSIAAWRIITRVSRAIRAHFGVELLRALRARVSRSRQ